MTSKPYDLHTWTLRAAVKEHGSLPEGSTYLIIIYSQIPTYIRTVSVEALEVYAASLEQLVFVRGVHLPSPEVGQGFWVWGSSDRARKI